ncbi:MAG TPA: Rrf2 family transcriptional regulator [Pyrinomonadaceae bacterium]|nr:Rrf2 family transcriptional regulator [Pyrinomonadaceae bacterium]
MPDKKVTLFLWQRMIFSKATSYGIRALAYIAGRPQRLCGLQEIAEHEAIPPAYLRKILGELRRHRLLRSVKGIHGGYELARLPEAITLWEVFKVLEPDPYMDTCLLGDKACRSDLTCVFHDDWSRVRKDLVSLLETRTIREAAMEITRGTRVGIYPQTDTPVGENRDDEKDEEDAIPSPA